MTKPIGQYTVDELSAKIEAIKAEREKAYNTLKMYEEELERRNNEVPLGVPANGEWYVSWNGVVSPTSFAKANEEVGFNSFSSEESAQKHSEMLKEWRKALVANAKGEPIDIKVLLPLLPKGWVCMNEACSWVWCKEKPELINNNWTTNWKWNCLTPFNLKPAEDWRNSLMECGL